MPWAWSGSKPCRAAHRKQRSGIGCAGSPKAFTEKLITSSSGSHVCNYGAIHVFAPNVLFLHTYSLCYFFFCIYMNECGLPGRTTGVGAMDDAPTDPGQRHKPVESSSLAATSGRGARFGTKIATSVLSDGRIWHSKATSNPVICITVDQEEASFRQEASFKRQQGRFSVIQRPGWRTNVLRATSIRHSLQLMPALNVRHHAVSTAVNED